MRKIELEKIESENGARRRRGKPGDWGADRARPLARSFYARSPIEVAKALLGMVLLRQEGGQTRAGRIVEVEAYLGAGDLAAHAASGITERNRVLFGPPGHAYVYFTYGMHYCMNVSCMPEDDAGSVLIRALEPLTGIRAMAAARGCAGLLSSLKKKPNASEFRRLASGPAMLCQALGITRTRDNGRDLTLPTSGIWIADDGNQAPESGITATCRIGIRKSAELPLRFFIKDNEFVSLKRIKAIG